MPPWPPESTNHEKGRDLETRIREFFLSAGYQAESNIVLEGRSGGRHEIDVLAAKDDGVTNVSVFVECKNWSTPIEKDVVAKAAYVANDLGLNKAIVVALQGWRAGADHAARELGVELWDQFELERRVGAFGGSASSSSSRGARTALAVEPRVSEAESLRLIAKACSGLVGRESVLWARRGLVPFYLVTLRVSRTERKLLGRDQARSESVTNVYDGLTGACRLTRIAPPAFQEVSTSAIVEPLVKERKLVRDLVKECDRLATLRSATALQRQRQVVEALGVPLPMETMEVERLALVHWPYDIGLLERRGNERFVAVNAATGKFSEPISASLTHAFGHVKQALST